jgi:hypothetical protein
VVTDGIACNKILKYHRNTTVMLRHLKACHKDLKLDDLRQTSSSFVPNNNCYEKSVFPQQQSTGKNDNANNFMKNNNELLKNDYEEENYENNDEDDPYDHNPASPRQLNFDDNSNYSQEFQGGEENNNLGEQSTYNNINSEPYSDGFDTNNSSINNQQGNTNFNNLPYSTNEKVYLFFYLKTFKN